MKAAPFALAGLAAALWIAPGCGREEPTSGAPADNHAHREGDGHDHGHDPAEPGHDDHDHGAGHSDADGHDHHAAEAPSGAHDHGADHADGDGHDHGHGDEPGEEGAHADEVTLPADAIKRWNIRPEPVRKRALRETFVAPGRVVFNQERIAHVGSVVSGRVSEIKIRVGDPVKHGQPLLVIASPEFGRAQSEFLQRRTEAETAEGMIEVARQAFERAQQLHAQNQSIALAEVQQRQGELRAAEGQARSARAAAVAAENALHVLGMDQAGVGALVESGEIDQRYTIAAPIDGVVVEREATLGESVGPETEALAVLANMETLWVLADVPEGRVAWVGVDAPATVRLAGRAAQTIGGKVSYISPQLNPATRTVPVRVEVSGGVTALRPGMFVEVELGTTADDDAEPVLAVPEAAVQTVEGGPAVFVAVEGEPNTFAKRAIKAGPPIGGMVPVLDGLREGERVVAHGSFILKADLGKAGAAHEH